MLSKNDKANRSELHIFQDKSLDFCAVISLKQYGRGPAIGGCRMLSYPTLDAAITDANRLAHAMSYKAAISQLPHDGGKAVIMRSTQHIDHAAILKRFSECVDSLNGRYITTIDSGTSQADMSIIKKYTPYVTGYLEEDLSDNNPSVSTALGIFKGIQAAVKLLDGRDNLAGLHVAIQGVGSVGYFLAKHLYLAGAKLTVCDIDPTRAQRCSEEFNATIVEPSAIYAVFCDVFAPCALGQIINPLTLSQFKTKIIAGAANDQLSSPEIAKQLSQRNILYVPDYLINAGGLIHLSLQQENKNHDIITEHVECIADRILNLAFTARQQQKTLYEMTEIEVERFLGVEADDGHR